MPKPIRLFAYEEDGELYVYGAQFLIDEIGLDTDEKVRKVYGDGGRWHEIVLKPATAKTERDIRAAARMLDPIKGFVLNENELPRCRAAVAVKSWTFTDTTLGGGTGDDDEPIPVTKEGHDKLSLRFSQIVDELIFRALYGGAVDDRFLAALKNKPNPSEENPPSP